MLQMYHYSMAIYIYIYIYILHTIYHQQFIIILYCTLCGRIKGTKCALFSIKCKGAVWKKMEKKHSYEVNLFIVFAPQHIPEGDNCIFVYQHYTR